MRLKTYSAPTMAEAMEMARQEMGEDAIIVSTQRGTGGHGARVTAALEEVGPEHAALEDLYEEEKPDAVATIRQALTFHGTPPRLAERLVEAAGTLDTDDPVLAFAGAMDATFTFAPLSEHGDAKPIMLVGTPGAGKTITTAKLAARATLAGTSVRVITTDTQRAGGVEQLAAFTRLLKLDLETTDTIESLREAVAAADNPVYIDTAGTNPFSDTEMDHLSGLVQAAGAEPVLVLAAGGDAMESADIAASFAAIGAGRLLVTRLDMARRLGSILAAADAARIRFSDVSITPQVADGLSPLNPVSLARLIMPHTPQSHQTSYQSEAAS